MNKEIIFNALFKATIVREFLKQPKITIVDIGAGFCHLEKKLLEILNPHQDILIIALDSSDIISNSKNDFGKTPFKIEFVISDANSPGLKDDSSDITFAINILPYIKNINLLLNELYRITHNDGIIVIVNPIKDKFNFWEQHFEGITTYFHEDIKQFLEPNKFEIVENLQIKVSPIEDVKMIKIPIAKLMVLRIVK